MPPRAWLALLLLAAADAVPASDEECLNYTVYPVQYELTVTPHVAVGAALYDAELLLTIIAGAPGLLAVELDARDLQVVDGVRVLAGERDITSTQRPWEQDSARGKLLIYLSEPLQLYSKNRQQYLIRIPFRKTLATDGYGVFAVPYEDGTGVSRLALVTRLAPNRAKYFMPCLEDPRFEAVFRLRVRVRTHSAGAPPLPCCNTSLGITAVQARHRFKDEFTIVDFAPSPQVALHQYGFHHSQFASRRVSTHSTNDTLVLWAPPHTLTRYDFILTFAERILHLIHEYSGVQRPLVRAPINIVAVPAHLDGYEIGSWSLLTNGETRLAHVSEFTSIGQEQRMTFELAQQLSRIWLGSPGEPERTRWMEEWFKEGVATYLAYHLLAQYHHGAESVKHKWPLHIYGLHMRHEAMAEDWHHSTRALARFNRTLAVEIPSRYKHLVAMKTASILWMVENWLGAEKFHMALVKYVNTRRGRHISVDDFMANLDLDTVECLHQFFNGSTASRILKSWFHQSGYPVIDVNVLRYTTDDTIQLKQRHLSFTGDGRGTSNYLIPISYVVQNSRNCLNCDQPRFTIEQVYSFKEKLNGGWIILNRNASGYYRVNYDAVTWKLITRTLQEDRLSIDELNRAQIVNDVFALYVAGLMQQSLARSILDYLHAERSAAVWHAASAGFELLQTEGAGGGVTRLLYQDWQKWMSRKVSAVYELMVDSAPRQPAARAFRSDVVRLACAARFKSCLDRALAERAQHAPGRRMEADCRAAWYRALLADSDADIGARGLNAYEVEDKLDAERSMRKERHFLHNAGAGISPPGELQASSPAPTPEETTPHSMPYQSTVPVLAARGAGVTPTLIATLMALATLLTVGG